MVETLRTEEEMLGLVVPGVRAGVSAQDLRDIIYSLLRAQFWQCADNPEAPTAARTLYWKDGNLNLIMEVAGVVRQLGEELQTPLCWNQTGQTILNGTVVSAVEGAHHGEMAVIQPSNGNTHPIGVATHDIADDSAGYATTFGVVRGLNTNAWVEGTSLWLGPNGALTSVRPVTLSDAIHIGIVTRKHPTLGEVLVAIHSHRDITIPLWFIEARPLKTTTTFSNLEMWSWTDLTYPAETGKAAASWVFEAYRDTPYKMPFFAYNKNEEMHLAMQMPHEWAGTDVLFHLHTRPMANGAGFIYWTGYYCWGQINEELPALSGWTAIAHQQEVTAADQYKGYLASIVTVPAPAEPRHSDILYIYLRREGLATEDTYDTPKDHGTVAANCGLDAYDVHYQRLTMGSREVASGRVGLNVCRSLFDKSVVATGSEIYVTATVRSTLGNEVEFRLYDETGGAVVDGTALVTGTNWTIITLGPLTLGDGLREYVLQGRHTGTYDEPVAVKTSFIAR